MNKTKLKTKTSLRKKAFTLVELVVVIAIIAILSAVSVVSYLSLTGRAKESNDVSLTTQMNTILDADETVNGKPKTMSRVVEVLDANGIDLETLKPHSSNYKYVWDSKNNDMLLLNAKKEVISPSNKVKASIKKANSTYSEVNVFVPIASHNEMSTWTDYSLYLKQNFEFANPEAKEVTVKSGLDVGKNEGVNATITLSGTEDVIVNTNGGSLAVNGDSSAEVVQYGSVNKVEVNTNATVTVTGTVEGDVSVAKGSVKVEEGASVASVVITATNENIAEVSVDVNSNASVGEVAATDSTVAAGLKDNTQINTPSSVEINDIKVEVNSDFAGGLGTEKSPYLVSSIAEFKNIDKSENDGKNFKVITDLVANEEELIDSSQSSYCLLGTIIGVTIDFSNNTVSLKRYSFDDNALSSIFDIVKNSTIKNLNVNLDGTQVVAMDFCGNSCFDNVLTKGTINVYGNQGAFAIYVYGSDEGRPVFKNCINEAEMYGTGDPADYNAVFAGYAFDPTDGKDPTDPTKNIQTKNVSYEVTFINCINRGVLSCGKASMFIGNVTTSVNSCGKEFSLNITNCKNEGSIVSANTIASQFSSVNEKQIKHVLYDGTEYSYQDKLLQNIYYHGADSAAFNLTVNDDKTLSFGKSSMADVSYYVVSIGLYYQYTPGGTNRYYVTETIQASEIDTYTTTIKNIKFAERDSGTAGAPISGYDTVIVDGELCYVLDVTDGHLSSSQTKASATLISVTAFDAEGRLLSVANLK